MSAITVVTNIQTAKVTHHLHNQLIHQLSYQLHSRLHTEEENKRRKERKAARVEQERREEAEWEDILNQSSGRGRRAPLNEDEVTSEPTDYNGYFKLLEAPSENEAEEVQVDKRPCGVSNEQAPLSLGLSPKASESATEDVAVNRKSKMISKMISFILYTMLKT